MAENLVESSESREEAQEQLRRRTDITPQAKEAASGIVDAHFASWRYLQERVGRILDGESDDEPPSPAVILMAEQAVELHNALCPKPFECPAAWYPLHALARTQCRAKRWDQALETIEKCKRTWQESSLGATAPDIADEMLEAVISYYKVVERDRSNAVQALKERVTTAQAMLEKYPEHLKREANARLCEAKELSR